MSNTYKHKHPFPSTSKPRLFLKILQIYNSLHICTTQYTAGWKNTISSRSWQLLSWSRYIPPFVKPEGSFLRYPPQRYVTFAPSCQRTHTLKQLNPLPSHVPSTALLYSHDPANETLLW